MLTCHPTSFFSWNSRVEDETSEVALVTFDWLAEQGTIATADASYSVRKHGIGSGQWSLERAGDAVVRATKPSLMFRRYELTSAFGAIDLAPNSPVGRRFDLHVVDRPLGTIRPAHAFTRRATIDCDPIVPLPERLFAFWLAALAWRRAARRD